MKNTVAVLLYLALLSGTGIARAQDPWISSASRVVSPTVAVRITWMDKTGNQQVSRGTAFLISREGHYITAAHIIPSGVNPDDLLIEAESRPFLQRRVGPVIMTLIGTPDRSNLVDFAVLRDVSISIKAAPLLYNPRIPAPPEELLIFGYAWESGSETNINRVAGEGDNESIKMHAFVKEGFSGAPVVDTYGSVIGMVRGGDPVAEIKSDAGVMGKALFVPISRIVNKVKNIAGVEWTEATVETEYKNTRVCVNFNCNIVSVPAGYKPTGD